MASILVIGAGRCGSLLAMLLDRDGHDVVALERDRAPPPDEPVDAWESWERTSVRQFHLPLLPAPLPS